MIFSISNIKKKDNNSSVDNRSLFELALENIKSHKGYKFITESIESTILNARDESIVIDENRIKSYVRVIAEQSIKGFKDTYERYLLNRDRVLNEVKNKISKEVLYKIDNDFFYNDYRYKYTNLRRVLSYSTFSTDIDKESCALIRDIDKYLSVKNTFQYMTLFNDFKVYKKNIANNIAMICADLLGENGPVDRDIFAVKLYGNFREYRIEMDSNISKDELLSIYDRYSTNETEKTIITNDFNKMIDDVAKVEDTVKSVNINYDRIREVMDCHDIEIRHYPLERIYLYLNVVNMILDIYQMFFAARLDACFECLVSDIDILLEARKYVENRQLTADNKQ